MDGRSDLKSMNITELRAFLTQLGEKPFRAGQVFRWAQAGVTSFDEMTDLPKPLREKLSACATLAPLSVKRRQCSEKDGTVKYLFSLEDGNCVESVLMKYKHGYSICISTQVGCRMGCAFCASGLGGKVRDLAPSEMLGQVAAAQRDQGVRISNIVLMGTGEPLDNFDNVMRFLALVRDENGLGIGHRHISLSTCGLVPMIDALAERSLQITLSVSLHAPSHELRMQLMPVERAYDIHALAAACRRYFEKTSRRISYEYAMIAGMNDTPAHARELARLLAGQQCHINLIPLNHVDESPFAPSAPGAVQTFVKILEERGFAVTVRRRLGSDIDASCGQLRRRAMKDEAERT